MKLKIFSVYDSKIQAYNTPFYLRTSGDAIRGWTTAVNDETTQFNKHPEDFTLFEIGEYDDLTGDISQLPAKHSLSTALSVLKPKHLPGLQNVRDLTTAAGSA